MSHHNAHRSHFLKSASKWKARRMRVGRDPADANVTVSPKCLAGTALSKLLARFGIKADEKDCRCRSRAEHMDAAGCDWCEANIDEIAGWLREEAKARGLPFMDAVGRMLIRQAIANARRKAAS